MRKESSSLELHIKWTKELLPLTVDAVESVKIAFAVTAEAVTIGGNERPEAGGGSTPALGTTKKIFIHVKEQSSEGSTCLMNVTVTESSQWIFSSYLAYT